MQEGPAWATHPSEKISEEISLNSLGSRLQEAYENLCESTNRVRLHADTLFGSRGEEARKSPPEDNTLISTVIRFEVIVNELRNQVNRF
jgi:hypothetical protein